MTKINLRDYYPFYTEDCFIEVDDRIAELLRQFDIREPLSKAGNFVSDDTDEDNDTSTSCCRLSKEKTGGEMPMMLPKQPSMSKNLEI